MRNRLFLALALPLFFSLAMGDLLAQAPTPEVDPTGSTGALKAQIQTGGSYDARSANGTRIVNDLKVPGALGAYGLDFTRYWNSLPNDYEDSLAEWPMDFGMSSWSHSWHWKAQYAEYSEVQEDGEEEIFTTAIMITFPDGHTTKFKITRSNRPHGSANPDPRLGPPYTSGEIASGWHFGGIGVHDHVCDMAVDGSQFWLCRADGGSVHFVWHTIHLVYQATEVFDPNGFRTDLTYNNFGYLSRVEQEGGRYLTITWNQFAGGWWAITRVVTGGGGATDAQSVIYKYLKLNGDILTLSAVLYQNDPAVGLGSAALYTYGFDYAPGMFNPSSFPLLKVADDPRYAGAMTKIAYEYSGVACPTPTPPPPWVYVPDYFHGQPSGITAEINPETNVAVSRFVLPCLNQSRTETNGLGATRLFYYGASAGTQDLTVPPPDGPLFCRGHELGKVTDFYYGSPGNVPTDRQNFSFGHPRQIWDGRNLKTETFYGDQSGSPSEIRYVDGSNSTYDRIHPGNSLAPDPSRIHNTYPHWLFSKKDERNQVTSYTRDDRRRVTRIDYPGGSSESYTYNLLNQVETHTLPSATEEIPVVQHYVYDGFNRLSREWNSVDGESAYTEYTYDTLGRVATAQNARARANNKLFSAQMEYNGRHLVTKVTYPASEAGAADPFVTYEYDKYGNCTAITNELGYRSTYTYDSYRRCTSYTEPLNAPGWNGGGTVASRTWTWHYDRYFDANGLIVASAHTSKQWRVQVEPAYNDAGHRRLSARKFDYNDQIIEEVTGMYEAADGSWHTGLDTELHTYTYDANGQKSTFTDPRARLTEYTYNNRNRLSTTREYPIPGDPTPPRTTETLYDPAGNKTQVTFPDLTTQRWEDYDAFGQAWKFFDERNNPTDLTYQWGPMKKLDTVRTYRVKDNNAGTETQETNFDYDGIGRLTKTMFPDTTFELNSYQFGQVGTWKTRRNQLKTITYDARGREQSHTWSDGTPGITRIWDKANRLISISNIFSAIDYSYDEAGQARWEGSTVNGAGARNQVTYYRFPSGEVSQTLYPTGSVTLQRAYTARGQLKSVGWGAGSTSYDYLPDGKVNYQPRGNDVTTTYGYDGRGMIGSVTHRNNAAGHDLAKRDYWRDNRDRIVAWKRGTDTYYNAMEDGRGDRYGYDAEGQLTSASYRALTPEGTPSQAMRTDSFVYDQLGNRKGNNYVANRKSWMNFTRRDNGLNQYHSWENDHPVPDPAHWGSGIFYDDNFNSDWHYPGNGVMMAEGHIVASYNALNQPVALWTSTYGSNYLWFGHDPLGRCVKRWNGPATAGTPGYTPATYYYYDGWNLAQEGPSASTADRTYVHGGRVDEIVASQVGGVWYYHHYDARGHCILLSNVGGGLQEQYDYDAFGHPYFYTASGFKLGAVNLHTRFLFTGREWFNDLKVYDYRNRMYQPELGRFLQPDPKQFEAGDYNLYRYCHNDPVNKSDPTGLDTYAIGPYISIGVGFHFNVSLQASLSTPYRLTDVANYRLGVILTLPAGGSSTGLGGSAGVAVTTSAANTPSELSGTSGTFGGSAGIAIVGGVDVGNVGAKIGDTKAPMSLTRSVGIGLKISPAIAPAPAEVHAGAAKTLTVSVTLAEIRNQQLEGPEKLKLKEK